MDQGDDKLLEDADRFLMRDPADEVRARSFEECRAPNEGIGFESDIGIDEEEIISFSFGMVKHLIPMLTLVPTIFKAAVPIATLLSPPMGPLKHFNPCRVENDI